MNKNLTVRYENETFNVSITANNADNAEKLIDSATTYRHGTYDSVSSAIECRTENDFMFCRKKAKALGLIPTVKLKDLKCS